MMKQKAIITQPLKMLKEAGELIEQAGSMLSLHLKVL